MKYSHYISQLRYLLLALMAFGAVQAIAQESTPNLSGIWKWIPEKSHVSGMSATDRRVKITQQGDDLTIETRTLSHVGDEITPEHIKIGVDDNNLKTHWKNGGLEIEPSDSKPLEKGHFSETWTLSADGQTLTYHATHQFGDNPPREDTIVYEKQAVTDWEPQRPPIPAEEAFKNIQVFKGTPAPEVLTAMRGFTRALGVKCEFCHVEKAFDKDDKPEKLTARKMILMARGIDKDNFSGERKVTCWTCHRGANMPQSAPPVK